MPLPDHMRTAVTPVSVTVQVDCSCGTSYTVAMPLNGGEVAALDKAQKTHAGIPENVSGLVHYVHDSETSGAADKLG